MLRARPRRTNPVNSNRTRLLVVIGLVSLVGVGWYVGFFERFGAETVEGWIRDAGPWGPVFYVGLFTLLESFGVPGIVFVVPGGLVWNWPTLFLLTWAGATGAAVTGFWFARTLGRDWVERRLSDRARMYDDELAANGLRTVITIRLLFFIAPWAHWLLGLSRVGFRDYLLGTIVGLAPMMALFTWFGGNIVAWIEERPLLATLGVLVAIAVITFAARRFNASVEARANPS